ncbi:hypothetical protein quinque_008183 [Culex quinquefasciatus]
MLQKASFMQRGFEVFTVELREYRKKIIQEDKEKQKVLSEMDEPETNQNDNVIFLNETQQQFAINSGLIFTDENGNLLEYQIVNDVPKVVPDDLQDASKVLPNDLQDNSEEESEDLQVGPKDQQDTPKVVPNDQQDAPKVGPEGKPPQVSLKDTSSSDHVMTFCTKR